ncbi:MAG: hypothetical protein FWB96_10070 [Defluviitaleaceae bacterium]|nr:hypothetical protein [Defluviitaleaceae bacterium]MCL2263217.1 hypothetical protein [Defluviitaleaceae bacterium]
MNNIQIINYSGKSALSKIDGLVVSQLNSPKSPDEFDITIIDLCDDEIWRSEWSDAKTVNNIGDFVHLQGIMERAQKTIFIVVFPKNCYFLYHSSRGSYRYRIELKNNLDALNSHILSKLIPATIPQAAYNLLYEETTTVIGDYEFTASFHFDERVSSNLEVLSYSRKSDKITTIVAQDKLLITSLGILASENHLLAFLKSCGLISEREEYPQWLLDYPVLNDSELNAAIAENESKIEDACREIREAKKHLQKNLEYKSVLFVSGTELVNVVFMILEEILAVDLSGFVDLKKEDFLFEIDEGTEFVGEVKGVKTNIRQEYVSQLDVHYRRRLDKLQDENISKTVKALLIINTLRNRPPSEREPSHSDPVLLAEQNKSLVIETVTLLKIYEFFVADNISTEKCKEMFQLEIGLLTEDVVRKYLSVLN